MEYHRILSLTIVIRYSDSCTVDLAQLGSTFRVKQLHLKVFILLWCHVINDWDLNVLQGLEQKMLMISEVSWPGRILD